MQRKWESVAERLRLALGIGTGEAEDPRVIAALCGLRLAPSRMVGAALYRDAIYFDAAAPLAERKALVAVELGRWALIREGLPAIEEGARHVGFALMVGSDDRSSGVYLAFSALD
jgi:hypothetical protein